MQLCYYVYKYILKFPSLGYDNFFWYCSLEVRAELHRQMKHIVG
jgi:hypothetical protein